MKRALLLVMAVVMLIPLTACNEEETAGGKVPTGDSTESGEVLTVEAVTNGLKEAGLVLENGFIPNFEELGAIDAAKYELSGAELVIYEYASAEDAIAAQEHYPMAAIYARNSNMLLNSEEENAIKVFLEIK